MTLFDIKKKIDFLMYDLFNFLSSILFFFNSHSKNLIKQNKKYKNIHQGERCFIVGTGPSINQLNSSQIKSLEKEKIFALNSFFKIDSLRNIIPNYYLLVDDVFWRNTWFFSIEDVFKHYNNSDLKIVTDYRAETLLSNSKFLEQTLFLHCKKYPSSEIDSNISSNMYVGINVASYAILTAIYMGFKEIYLLGCDYTSFATAVDEHSYDDVDEQYEIKDRLGMLLSFYSEATRIHYLIRDYAKKNGLKIINATPGSLLDSYERGNISKVLN